VGVGRVSAGGRSVTGVATSRSRATPAYRCTSCGWTTAKWVGRCGECQEWGSVAEIGAPKLREVSVGPVTAPAVPIGQVGVDAAKASPTGVGELDRVLGGGLVEGAVVLVAGEPGVGKSTLLLEVAARASAHGRVLYLTGEESAAQVRLRAARVGAITDELYLAAESDLGAVLAHIDAVGPALLVVDSVQTIAAAEIDGTAGGVTQVREVAGALIRVAKERGLSTLLVGHVTKDGSIAGPRVLEHLVDVVLQFEGDQHGSLRMIRAAKNRYGPTDEVGCFALDEGGIVEVPDPSGLFLSRSVESSPGTCVTVTLEGRRPLVAEVQALVAESALATPRRATSGLDASRTAMVLAVLERRAGVPLGRQDVYVATVGGVRVTDPATDLALALSVAGAAGDLALRPGLVAVGEVGLAGELRPVSGIDRRLAEAARLGFTHALVPRGADAVAPDGMAVLEADDLRTALRAALP
jgi:DNA repair protein RadA/Sms